MRTSPDDNGFTLLELLVVMVIIGVLAAIAVPTFLAERGKSYQSAMKADLHEAVVAETAYSVGHDASYTVLVSDLDAEGYRTTTGVTPAHVKLVSSTAYVACVKHASASTWLTYDSTTGQMSSAAADCAA